MGKSRKRRSERWQKIEFLRHHPELHYANHRDIQKELVKAGLVSPTTYRLDLGISKLLEAAKTIQ